MAELLLRAGASVNASNRYEVTPLWQAAMIGNPATISVLLNAGADLRASTRQGETVLMRAARAGRVDAVKLLLARGASADVNAKESWYGQTALMWAAAENHPAVVQALIENGANVDAQSAVLTPVKRQGGAGLQAWHTTFPRGGMTALLFAARQGVLDAVRTLIAAGADVNRADPDGISPLIMAIINAHYDVAALLVEKGADVNRPDSIGQTPLYAAVDMHTLEWRFNRAPPKSSGTLDSVDIVRLLLARGADPNARLTRRVLARNHDANGNANLITGATPFLKAATTADVAVMQLLLDWGADPFLNNSLGTNALMMAAGLKWSAQDMSPVIESGIATEVHAIEAIKLCVAWGFDINAANDEGQTALHGAAERGADSIIEFLAARGAILDRKDKRGQMPIDMALNADAGRGHPESVALLRGLMIKKGIPVAPAAEKAEAANPSSATTAITRDAPPQ
jgi:ankyrin repeat protein